MGGTPNLDTDCGVYVNSNSPTALSGNGTPTLRATQIDIVGNYTFSGTMQPYPPSTGVAPLSDPFASLPAPTVPAGCDHNNFNANGNVTLNPGVYCNGIDIRNANATMNPGTYIIKGGGLTTQSANSHLTGNGVTLYNTYDGSHSYGSIDINANSTVSLTAPTTGTYAGVLLMEDRSIPAGTYTDSFGGGSYQSYTGIIYAPKSNMNYSGNAASSAYTILVSWRLQMVGTSTINNDYSSLPTGNPIKVTALVE